MAPELLQINKWRKVGHVTWSKVMWACTQVYFYGSSGSQVLHLIKVSHLGVGDMSVVILRTYPCVTLAVE